MTTTATAKMTSSGTKFARAFSLRDKKGRPRSRIFETFMDSDATIEAEHTDPYGLFTFGDDAKRLSKDEDRKIEDIQSHFSSIGLDQIPESRIAYALRAPGVGGDTAKAMELISLFQDSLSGIIRPYDPRIKMVGAVNREKVTCYLDATLFAMFAKPSVFEATTYHHFDDEPRRKLVTLLRVWINMLRTGQLITIDITRKLQESLAECGWEEAARVRQQDASEAFGFLTDKLELPLLTLKTDLFHQGKHDKDDHKFITERLLDVGIPEDTPANVAVPLEKLLEDYFNNKVEVKREIQRRNTLSQQAQGDTARSEDEKENASHIESAEVESRAETPRPTDRPAWPAPPRPLSPNDRTTSIFSERRVSTIDGVTADKDRTADATLSDQSANVRKGSVRREVAMPAWQFLNLIPWYADNSSEADTQVKAHFASRRPMLGICLKRYKVSSNGTASRLGTQIDIPLEMAPPHFAVEDRNQADESANPNLKLVLQSVVCHRGQHVNSGHYISLVRTSPPCDSHGSFPDVTAGSGPDYNRDVWLRHDDLSINSRVTIVDIKQALKAESPYLLFYQVLPVDEDSFSEEPPPYQESDSSLGMTIGEKLAGLQSPGRPSMDPTIDDSRRPSLAISDELRSQTSNTVLPTQTNAADTRPLSFLRQDSNGNTDSASMSQRTRPTTPRDDLKQVTPTEPRRVKTRSARPSNDVGRKMGEFVSRLGGGGSREKVNVQEAVIAVADDSSEDVGAKEAQKQAEGAQDPQATAGKSKTKEKDKKSKTKSKSRRSSVPLGRLPDRECSVM